MNNQTVAIITTNEIAEKIKERLNEFPEELQDVKIVNNKENTNIFYWDYKPFFYAIEDKLKIKESLKGECSSTALKVLKIIESEEK